VSRELKLIGFVLLLVAIFVGTHSAGAALGPVTTGHSQVEYTGQTGTGGGMNMGATGRGNTPGSTRGCGGMKMGRQCASRR
jgi:hypothetical protein